MTLHIFHASHWLAALLLLSAAAYGLRFKSGPVVKAWASFCILAGHWALFSALIALAPDLETKVVLNRIKLFAPALLPLSILAIAMKLYGHRSWLRTIWVLFSIVPIITVLLIASPDHHEFFIKAYRLFPLGPYRLLAFSNGPWFNVHILNAQLAFILAIVLLWTVRRDLSSMHCRRVWIMIAAFLIPFAGDVLAVHFMIELRYIQIAPTFLLASAALMMYALMHHHLIDVVPFAREHILDSTDDLYLILDGGDVLLDFNERAGHALHLAPSDIGKTLRELSSNHPEIENLTAHLGEKPMEWTLDRETYEVRRSVLNDPGSGRGGSVIACKCITIRKHTEQALEDLNQIKTKLLAVVGHDMQGNLAALLVIAQNLAQNCMTMPSQHIQQAFLNVEMIARQNISLIESLLDWSKHRLGAHTSEELVDLNDLTAKVTEFLQPTAAIRGVTIKTISTCKASIRSDNVALTIILRNLLSNAIKASPVNSIVFIKINTKAATIEITVEDSGPGIPKEKWPDLFELKKEKRAGIGLFLCREFTECIGGTLWFESEAGCGSRFTLALPNSVNSSY